MVTPIATETTTPVVASKPRLNDDVPTMMAKIDARIRKIEGHPKQTELMWADAQRLEVKEDRDGLVKLFGRIGRYMGELARFEQFYTSQVVPAWEICLSDWITWIHEDGGKNLANRQLAMNLRFFVEFQSMERNMASKEDLFRGGLDAGEALLDKLEDLSWSIHNHVQNFCLDCGTPIEDSFVRSGKIQKITRCGDCHNRPTASSASKKATTTHAKKTGPKQQQDPEAIKAAKRARHQAKQDKLDAEMRDLQNLRPGENRDGAAKKARDQKKEARKQGDDPDREQGKKKGGKKKGSGTKPE